MLLLLWAKYIENRYCIPPPVLVYFKYYHGWERNWFWKWPLCVESILGNFQLKLFLFLFSFLIHRFTDFLHYNTRHTLSRTWIFVWTRRRCCCCCQHFSSDWLIDWLALGVYLLTFFIQAKCARARSFKSSLKFESRLTILGIVQKEKNKKNKKNYRLVGVFIFITN